MKKFNYIRTATGQIIDTVETHSEVLASEFFEAKHWHIMSGHKTIAAKNKNGTINCTYECEGITVEQINQPEPIGTEWRISDGHTTFTSSIRPVFAYYFLKEAIQSHQDMQADEMREEGMHADMSAED